MMGSVLPYLLAPVALAILVFALLWTDAGMRGWRRLATRFATTVEPPDARHQDGSIGEVGILQLRGLLRAAAPTDGLYLAPPRFMRRTHRPLLIPWDQLVVREEVRRVGVPILTLSVGRVHAGFVTLRGGIAGDVLERMGR
jgi:hypothetical protein